MRPIDFLDSEVLRIAARAVAATHVTSLTEPRARLEDTPPARFSPVRIGTASFAAEWLPQAHRSST